MSKSFAQGKAREILRQFSIENPPVNIEEIIEGFALKIEQIEADNTYDGELIYEKRLIRVNRLSPKTRQRYTLAHELGHWVLYHQNRLFEHIEESGNETEFKSSNLQDSEFSNKERETEANIFSSELLIPMMWLERDWKKFGQNAKKIAEFYCVSEEALWWKLLDSGIVK